MKVYVKPIMEYVELTVEERFAGGSGCIQQATGWTL